MNLRIADWADEKFAEYLILAEYREWTSSAKPSVTGYVSDCCRAETRAQRNGNVACIHCGRTCATSSWHSPLSGGASRGGWDPSPVWRNGAWWPREQVMYVNETRTRNHRAVEDRLANGAALIMGLKYLFDTRPRDMSAADWWRAKLAWEAWLVSVDMQRVAVGMAYHAGNVCWTPKGLEHLIVQAREHVWEKFQRARKRRREHPWAMEWGRAA